MSQNDTGEESAADRSSAALTMVCPVCAATYAFDTRFCPTDGSVLKPIANDADDLVGSVIDGRYYVLEKLGQGGMGEVYLGEHVLTKRRSAVKIVRKVLAGDPDAFGRFIREATNAGRISHPHVATVYDFGKTEDGMLYLAMEYVDGEPLSVLLEREGALPPARATEIARQTAEAVGAAHELAIVHRDLKPGNILIARDRKGADVIKVVDFGIARATTDEQQNLTRTGLVVGTPEYMSPEQLIGDPVDGRADIYALGCILYQMLTGEHAFTGSTVRLITRRLTERPPRPRERNPSIPKALDDVVVTALGKTPQERYQTMEELHDALVAAPAQPVTTGPRRLAAWLGRKSSKEGADGSDPVSGTAERLAFSTSREQRTAARPVTTRPVTQAQEPVQPPVPPISLTRETTPPLFAEVASIEPVHEDPVAPLPPEPEVVPEPASFVRAIAVGLTAGVVLLVAVLALRPSDPEPTAGEPEPPVEIEAEVAVPALPDTVLASIRDQLATAEREDSELQFVAAIGRLRSIGLALTALASTYPEIAELRVLGDSAHAQLEKVQMRCNTRRNVALARNETPPVCEAP